MIEVLYTLGSFLIAISLLIAFHEFGHYWVAKRLGVKVLRYSIGFGKPLWRKTAGPDKTEYVLAALPLGGYVKMLDEREGEVADAEKHRAFNRQKLWKRFAIVFAGPAFNILLAVLAYLFVSLIGTAGFKPMVALVVPGSPAASAGLESGMQIVSVEGWRTPTWDAVFQESLPRLVEKSQLQITAKLPDGIEHNYTLDLSGLNLDTDIKRPFKALGIHLFDMPPLVGDVVPDSPAAKAGLKPGDRIIQLDNKPVIHWTDISDYVVLRPDQDMQVEVKRKDEILNFKIHSSSANYKGRKIGRLGISRDATYPKITDKDRAIYKLGLLH